MLIRVRMMRFSVPLMSKRVIKTKYFHGFKKRPFEHFSQNYPNSAFQIVTPYHTLCILRSFWAVFWTEWITLIISNITRLWNSVNGVIGLVCLEFRNLQSFDTKIMHVNHEILALFSFRMRAHLSCIWLCRFKVFNNQSEITYHSNKYE